MPSAYEAQLERLKRTEAFKQVSKTLKIPQSAISGGPPQSSGNPTFGALFNKDPNKKNNILGDLFKGPILNAPKPTTNTPSIRFTPTTKTIEYESYNTTIPKNNPESPRQQERQQEPTMQPTPGQQADKKQTDNFFDKKINLPLIGAVSAVAVIGVGVVAIILLSKKSSQSVVYA